ncbi:hypothetical protein HORIV_57520 [Vreelandella olivaria]|uniref:NADH dehydrogenase subunit 4L n=1 Tax=Vreelandella olivaria TaxID=390919 RepID=A0ABN5X2M2_9GAMM|nr:hypothetical protein HORIV_57520 [Halomonas olivaria]
MKPTQSLFKMFLLPILMVVLPALLLMAIAMEIRVKQSLNNVDTIVQLAMMLLGICMMGGLIGVAFFSSGVAISV